jgi:hypothetical protein
MKKYQTTMAVLAMAFLGMGVVATIWGLWQLERYVHYRFSYKSMVEQTVREMVKTEALKP